MERVLLIALILAMLTCCTEKKHTNRTVANVMDSAITRLYAQIPPEKFNSIDDKFVLDFLSPEEEKVLATRYQHFTVNVPIVVSLMHHNDQKVLPFWLEGSGFVKTGQIVTNSNGYVYDIFQKKFPAGTIELGINGFDKHRPVYFITVTPQDPTEILHITEVYPSEYPITLMKKGAFVYHDWSDLVFTEVPEELVGQKLFTTVRGRAREAHIINGFRQTPFPSSTQADQVMLTQSNTPTTSMDVQWRTNTQVNKGTVRYWTQGKADTVMANASTLLVEDRMLYNDRYINRHTAQLTQLTPGTTYFYQAGSVDLNEWSTVYSFKTESDQSKDFSFVWFGDTHCFPDSGKLVTRAVVENKDAAFYSIAGDIVSTGLNRDEWDNLFAYGEKAFANKPLMPVPGNHDRQDGLGAQLYYDLFSLPKNGPEKVAPESSYYFEYGDAVFIMIDATHEIADHTTWIEKILSTTKAKWKFVMFHFPPYNYEDPYLAIQQSWVPLFDKYHVDMVMAGHIHYYMRSHPMNNGNVVDTFDKGTVYVTSISRPDKKDNMTKEPYAVKQFAEGYYYQRVSINKQGLTFSSVDANGKMVDTFEIKK